MREQKKAQGTMRGKTKGTAKNKSIASIEERLNSEARLKLSDVEKVHEMLVVVRKAYNKSGRLIDVRELLKEERFRDVCLRMILSMERGSLKIIGFVPREAVLTPNEWIAENKEMIEQLKLSSESEIEKEDLDREDDYWEQIQNLYHGALEALHKDDGGKSIVSYLRKNGEGNNTVILDLAAKEENDSIYGVNWKCKMGGRVTMQIHLRPTVKARLKKNISDLHASGLLAEVGKNDTDVIGEALFSMLDIMNEFKVTPGEIWKNARIALGRSRRGDLLFTEAEVQRLILEEGGREGRLELYLKMRDYKKELHDEGLLE